MKPFLTAEWTNLINITYAVPPRLLLPYLPNGVELDVVNGNAFVSLVPFDFSNTRFLGMKIPFHVHFPEVNFRFYVKYQGRRGVIFLKEFVSKFFIGATANIFYHEHYECTPLRSHVMESTHEISCEHVLTKNRHAHRVRVIAEKKPYLPVRGTLEHYFEERYDGFAVGRKKTPLQFRVQHDQWKIYPLARYEAEVDYGSLIGPEWEFLNEQEPLCVMLIQGSAVKMFPHQRLEEIKKAPPTIAEPFKEQEVFSVSPSAFLPRLYSHR